MSSHCHKLSFHLDICDNHSRPTTSIALSPVNKLQHQILSKSFIFSSQIGNQWVLGDGFLNHAPLLSVGRGHFLSALKYGNDESGNGDAVPPTTILRDSVADYLNTTKKWGNTGYLPLAANRISPYNTH